MIRIDEIPQKGFGYLATPYRAYPGGIDSAYYATIRVRAKLATDLKRRVWSPIAAFHPTAFQTGIEPHLPLWQELDDMFLNRPECSWFVVGMLDGWKSSEGLAHESKIAQKLKLPMFYFQCDERTNPFSNQSALGLLSRSPPA